MSSPAENACDFRGEYLTLSFSPLSVPLRTRWRNNGLSADFLGDYATTFLPAEQNVEVRHAVSYIANELLENAMKYHAHGSAAPIHVHMELNSENIAVRVGNSVEGENVVRYRAFVDEIRSGDPDRLMLSRIESAAETGGDCSGLGLLTMMTDYKAKLNWEFDLRGGPSQPGYVTTTAVIPLGSLAGPDDSEQSELVEA